MNSAFSLHWTSFATENKTCGVLNEVLDSVWLSDCLFNDLWPHAENVAATLLQNYFALYAIAVLSRILLANQPQCGFFYFKKIWTTLFLPEVLHFCSFSVVHTQLCNTKQNAYFTSLITDSRIFDFIRHLSCFFSPKRWQAFLNDIWEGVGRGGRFAYKFDT